MKWSKINEHYAESDTGYRITIGQYKGQPVHCATAPKGSPKPQPCTAVCSISGAMLIGYFHGPAAKRAALDACDQHAEKPG